MSAPDAPERVTLSPDMIDRAAKVADELIYPYDAWGAAFGPQDLAEAMLRAALGVEEREANGE